MLFSSEISAGKRQFYHAIFIPLLFSLIFILVFVLESGMNWDFHTAGVFPRKLTSMSGIFTLIFIHSGWEHLINNVISFTLLASCLYYFYSQIATKVFLLSYFFSGLILWFIGRDSWHIGASGLIYSIAFFLFFSGIFRKYVPLIAISLVLTFLYGSMVWYLLPLKQYHALSWEGHLSGAMVGLVLSVIYRNQGPQKPVKQWDEEDDENDDVDFDNAPNYEAEDDEEMKESKVENQNSK